MLRFSFMGTLVDSASSYRFLSQLAQGTEEYIGRLERLLPAMHGESLLHARLALLSGVEQ